jgi:uroporphyrinogen decarboxylase
MHGMCPHRDRLLTAYQGGLADRIPVVRHPSPAGLYVHGAPLRDCFLANPPDNHVAGVEIPVPPPDAVDGEGRYYERRLDEWGVTWEYRIVGLHGHACGHPFSSWRDASSYSFPSLPVPGSHERERIRQHHVLLGRTHLVESGTISLMERLCALRPMDEVLMGFAEDEPDLLGFLDRLESYWMACIGFWLEAGTDLIAFGDDWGTQRGPLVSPGCFDRHFAPRYRRLIETVHAGGARAMFHCCGRTGPLFERLLDLGIDAFWPQITAYDENDLFHRCRQRNVLLWIHPDRQYLVPHGTPAAIDERIHSYAERIHAQGGGGLFYLELEDDAPLANALTLVEAVERWR